MAFFDLASVCSISLVGLLARAQLETGKPAYSRKDVFANYQQVFHDGQTIGNERALGNVAQVLVHA